MRSWRSPAWLPGFGYAEVPVGAETRSAEAHKVVKENRVMQLSKQVALVTGAGQGIGKASALTLAAAGADIVAVGINRESVKETAAAIIAQGRKSLAIEADMGSVPDIDRMVIEAAAVF